jgi:hypothetical protein
MAGEVVGMKWAQFKDHFAKAWKPGQHIGVCGPTGGGKSTFVGGILELRRYVLVADPKGGDETLHALGLERLAAWPGNQKMKAKIDKNERDGRPSRYVVGPIILTSEDQPKLKTAIASSLVGAFDMGGWTYYLDELQVAADRRMLNLSGEIDNVLVAARSKGLSLIVAMQQPKWVTSASLTQPTWFAVTRTRDTDTVNRLAELMGRPKAEIRGALKGLDEYCWAVIGRDPYKPIVVTKPDMIKPKRTH